jgi:hypothetical protein
METTFEDLYTLQRHCKGKNPVGVLPLSFLHFCDYVPHDEHNAET